jgi:HAD superfamily hydrolase (TIGR01490 family)
MGIAFFDLDNTLIAGDSDYLWGEHLVGLGAVDAQSHRRENQRFYEEYCAGTLDQTEFLRFQLHPLTQHEPEVLEAWRAAFVRERIVPIVLPKALALLDEHRAAGRPLVIVTSTNAFITEPIAKLLGVDALLATQAERIGQRYTGRPVGVPCYGAGKIEHVNSWLEDNGGTMRESWFYSDSFNDVPLLEAVAYPIAVDPDERLEMLARDRGWSVTSLR